MIEAVAVLCSHDELLDCIGIVVELGDSCGLLKTEEVVAMARRLSDN
jgi:hypothetical protein